MRWQLYVLMLISMLVCGILIFYIDVFQTELKISTLGLSTPRFVESSDGVEDFLIMTEGCRIPYLDPFNDSVIKFIFDENKVICNQNKPPLMDSNLTHVFLVEESLLAYNVTDLNALKCCFSIFTRVIPNSKESDNKVSFEKCVPFNKTALITAQFVRVTCTYKNDQIYKDFFSFVPLSNAQSFSQAVNSSLSVLIIGLDGVSRVNLHRQMPKTVNVLKNISAVEFLGYSKVADNTFPNVVPILTGLNETELVADCWPHVTNKFDNCSFIWKDFSRNGYVTAFGEDSAWMGMFNYAKRGFEQQPTDYFWDPFNYHSEKEIGNQHRLNVDQCVGSRETYTVLLDYIKKLIITMQKYNRPYFGFFWGSSLSHDYLNKPRLGDHYYASFIQSLSSNKFLKNTALLFMSDHGIRWGEIRATYQGRMEERLPFLFILLPESYQKAHSVPYNNLKKNAKRLTTPFDLYYTLKDLLNSNRMTQKVITSRTQNRKGDERAYSLFEPIPTNRTCASADITSHWCTCQNNTEINRSSVIATSAVNFCINYINKKLVGYAGCAKLKLFEILNIREHLLDQKVLESNYDIDYTVVFKTLPGEGIFEATVRKHFDRSNNRQNFSMTGIVSRINLYGNQSSCMTDFHLKLYCYCV